MKSCKGVKIIGVICKIEARRHSNRLEGLDNVTMVRKCDIARLHGRKNVTGHPLDRNGLHIQGLEGMGKRKGGIWWIEWEAKVADLEDLQPVKVWKDIYRALHPLGQLDVKSAEGVADMQTSRSHKVEYSNRIFEVNYGEIRRYTSAECGHQWLYEPVKTAGHFEGFKVHQRLQDLEASEFSIRWR